MRRAGIPDAEARSWWQTDRVLTWNTSVVAVCAGVALCAGCGASSPEAAPPSQEKGSPAPIAAQSEPAGALESAAPPKEGTSPPNEARSPPVACRVETAALTCISRACFGRPDRKLGTGPSGFLPVQIRFDASGEISAFEPEGDAPEWREVLACARGCVERSARPRDCQTRIYLHTQSPRQ
jgi:hypothetical protein